MILPTDNYKINVHKFSDFNYSHYGKLRLISLDCYYSIYINLMNHYLPKIFATICFSFKHTISLSFACINQSL